MSSDVKRSTRLRVMISERYVPCPYQSHVVHAIVCFQSQRNPSHPFCFRCPDGATFEEKYGARSYSRITVPESTQPPEPIYLPTRVKVSRKKHGIDHTYAYWHLKEHRLSFPWHEKTEYGTYLSGKKMNPLYTEDELGLIAKRAASMRNAMKRGEKPALVAATPPKTRSTKTMISKEMQSLIDDRKRRDAMPKAPTQGYFGHAPISQKDYEDGIRKANAAIDAVRGGAADKKLSMFGARRERNDNGHTRPQLSLVKKPAPKDAMSVADTISSEAKRLMAPKAPAKKLTLLKGR